MGIAEEPGTSTQLDEPSTHHPDRRNMLLAIIGVAGMVIGIVALIIAIAANNASQSDAKVTAQVHQEAQVALAGVRNELRRDAASAAALVQHLQVESNQATRARRNLLAGVEQNKAGVATNRSGVATNRSGVATNRASISDLASTVTTLNGDVQTLSRSVDNLKTSQDDLGNRVSALEQASGTTP